MKRKTNRKAGTQDDCETPAYGLAPLLHFLGRRKGFKQKASTMTVWEPATGSGMMAAALGRYFRSVWATDIRPNPYIYSVSVNFLSTGLVMDDCTITNPPWSKKYQWLKHCYELGEPFALLVPAETMAAQAAHKLFEEYGRPWVIWMSPRIDFKMPYKGWKSTSHISTIWLTHHMLGGPGGGNLYFDLTKAKSDWLYENPTCRPVHLTQRKKP